MGKNEQLVLSMEYSVIKLNLLWIHSVIFSLRVVFFFFLKRILYGTYSSTHKQPFFARGAVIRTFSHFVPCYIYIQ